MFGAKRIMVSVSLGRLFRGQIVIPQVELIEPVINLERDSKGRASWVRLRATNRLRNYSRPSSVI
jgi:uncharacterized protein involved in outer membrane biogenesis